jgi:putative oxidoreductase
MKFLKTSSLILARFLLSIGFLAGALDKIFHWHEAEKNLSNTLCEWQSFLGFSEGLQSCFAWMTPWSALVLIAMTLFELIGGLLILLGVKEKLGAGLVIFIFIPMTVILHPFWFIEGPEREIQTILFLKNLGILGGLILLLLQGAQVKAGSSPMTSFKIG